MTTEKAAAAVRVITAINNRKTPEERDVFLLRLYCPDYRHCDPDELACFAIQESLKRRQRSQNGDSQSVH